ncbi:hypothetical protein PY093_20635 [Cytobacillus sp. S13-E01]|uniref:hypothetical protein n=1 Tax=Cytobacillus sp. S13-E01 TaxID=3031326 RepID=UPI0023D7BAB1|nr:hypothetical protein [Cytobacillus sp. S13-E01]MDF0729017.1 hypothetical protein [Cytobacillus sp. S13-E01]
MIHISQLKEYKSFFVETSVNDKFEFVRVDNGFIFRDITPPLLEKEITDLKSVKIPNRLLPLIKQGISIDSSELMFFDGIEKGSSLVFYDNEGMALTNGKITELYLKQKIGQFEFTIHLLESAGKKVDLYSLATSGFEIQTDMNNYAIEHKEDGLYFENSEVYAIYSLFRVKANSKVMHLDSLNLIHEYDVHPQFLFLNKPFIILRKENSYIKVSVIFENVKAINPIIS